MADSWNVTFKINRKLSKLEIESIESKIPRSAARLGEGDTSVVGVRQGAPTSMDAINRVGSALRHVLGRSRLDVIDVRAQAVSEDQRIEDQIDDLVRKFKG